MGGLRPARRDEQLLLFVVALDNIAKTPLRQESKILP